MAVIWATAMALFIFGSRDQKLIAGALVVSWIGARVTTVTGQPLYSLVSLTVAGLLAYSSSARFAQQIATIYAFRLILMAVLVYGVLDWFWLWELNRVLLYMQIILVIGGASGGGHRKRVTRLTLRPGRYSYNLSKLAQWLKPR